MGFNGINRCVKYSLAAGVREGRVRSREVFIKREGGDPKVKYIFLEITNCKF